MAKGLRLTLPVALASLALAACGSSASSGGTGSARTPASSTVTDKDVPATSAPASSLAPCGNQITPDPAAVRRVPRGFPTLAGWTATGAVTQGTTVALRGAIRGEPRDIVDVRDTAVHRLVTQGYVKTGGDEEPGFEADADFSGPHRGNINVRAACQHYLVVTYTLQE